LDEEEENEDEVDENGSVKKVKQVIIYEIFAHFLMDIGPKLSKAAFIEVEMD
jgi:hypothetical protein